MSYTPTEWKKGDVITATKLNKIEQGIEAASSGPSVLTINIAVSEQGTATMDKTFSEILTAFQSGSVIRCVWTGFGVYSTVSFITSDENGNNVSETYLQTTSSDTFFASTTDDYPSFTHESG